MQKSSTLAAIALTAFVVIPVFPGECLPAGFQAYFEQSAGAMGMAGAVVARCCEPSALFYNPAAAIGLQGIQIQAHFDGLTQHCTYVDPALAYPESRTGLSRETIPLGSLYFTHAVAERVVLGFAVNTPYGARTDWPDNWLGRYYAEKTTLRTVYASPTVSYQLTPHVSVGMGVSVVWGEAILEQAINAPAVFASAVPELASAFAAGAFSAENDILSRLAGDDWAYGARLGLHWRAADRWSFGAAYQSSVTLDLTGRSTYTIPDYDDKNFGKVPGAGTVADQLAAGLFPDSDIETRVRLPASLTGGVAFKATDELVLETDVTWTGWSSYDEMTVVFDHLLGSTGVESTTPKEWWDSFTYRLGLEYELSEQFSGRAGYAYDRSPIPNSTRDPSLPGADRHDLTLGVGYDAWPLLIDASYLYAMFEDAPSQLESAENGALPGSYETTAHVFAVSLGLRFQ